jgi:adenosylcobinamide-GDP ribazoletransferase
LKSFLTALQFLTILPIRIYSPAQGKELSKSMAYFPVVGGIIGIVLGGGWWIFSKFLPLSLVWILLLILLLFLTGGLHIEGFIDMCDGFSGGKNKQEILKIMQDSRVGSIGSISGGCLLLFKYLCLLHLPQNFVFPSLITMPTLGRYLMVVASAVLPYAREEGTGKAFVSKVGKREVLLASIFTFGLSFALLREKIFILFPFIFLFLGLFCLYIKKKLGGVTGDILGGVNEITEVLILFLVLSLNKWLTPLG